jgi:3-hydroxyacyl-CoA dehydrogenase
MKVAVARASERFDGLVIGNEGPAFSAGANLKMILEAIRGQKYEDIERLIKEFQGVLQMVKFAPFPTVAAPFNLVLGGGCEVALHTTHRVAAAETYAGLVEMGVGLVPAGGGTKELALRAYQMAGYGEKADPMAFLQRAFLLIGTAKTSSSAFEATEMGLFPWTTDVCLSTKHILAQAKRKVQSLARDGYVPKVPARDIKVVGDPGIQTFKLALYNMVEGQQITAYDALIGEKVASILCGGAVDGGTLVDEQWFLELERAKFMELCHEPKTVERIESMLKTGKPLRN